MHCLAMPDRWTHEKGHGMWWSQRQAFQTRRKINNLGVFSQCEMRGVLIFASSLAILSYTYSPCI